MRRSLAAWALGERVKGPVAGPAVTWPPGAAFEYSNLNYTTLGLVVEMAAGEPFDAYLKTQPGPPQKREPFDGHPGQRLRAEADMRDLRL